MARVLLMLLCLVTLASCQREVFRWKQKITVTVETPTGEVSGSAVQSLVVSKALYGRAGQPPGSNTELQGEAVAVEVLPGRWLFLLLEGPDVWLLPSLVRPGLGEDAGKGVRSIEVLRAAGAQPIGAEFTIPLEGMPQMVTFDDIRDPKTVRLVDPLNLAASFGPGVGLKSATLLLTDEPVTEGAVQRVLSWLIAANFIVKPDPTDRYGHRKTLGQTIMPSDFIDWRTLQGKREGKQ